MSKGKRVIWNPNPREGGRDGGQTSVGCLKGGYFQLSPCGGMDLFRNYPLTPNSVFHFLLKEKDCNALYSVIYNLCGLHCIW